MTLPKGTKLFYNYENETDTFEIVDSRNVRGKYIYILKDGKGKRQSLTRDSVLDAIERRVFIVL